MKKNILIGLLIILSMLFGGTFSFILFNNNDDNNYSGNLNNVLEFNSEEQKIIDSLNKYGEEIYNNKEYLNFNKDKQGVYYASINDLEKLGYDISVIDKECTLDEPIIYFDVDNIMNNEYYDIPLIYIINCE